MSVTDAMREAYADPDAGDDIAHTLELDHASFPEPVRVIANAFDDMSFPLAPGGNPVLFKACPVSITLQGVDDDGPTQGLLRIDNVSQILSPGLEAAVDAGVALTLIYRGYLMSDPFAPGDERRGMFVQRVSLFATYATGTIEAATKADRQAFPLPTYDIANYQSLHDLF